MWYIVVPNVLTYVHSSLSAERGGRCIHPSTSRRRKITSKSQNLVIFVTLFFAFFLALGLLSCVSGGGAAQRVPQCLPLPFVLLWTYIHTPFAPPLLRFAPLPLNTGPCWPTARPEERDAKRGVYIHCVYCVLERARFFCSASSLPFVCRFPQS